MQLLIKFVSNYKSLNFQYNGGPALSSDDHCRDCLIDGARTLVSADSYRDRRTSMKQIAEDALAGRCEDGTYFVSRAWYDSATFYISSLTCWFGLFIFSKFSHNKYSVSDEPPLTHRKHQ